MDNQNIPTQQPMLIEQTAKKWKKLRLIGVLVFIFGGVLALVAQNGFTLTLPFIGAGIYAWGRFGGWWHHG